ncbi:hypothetical protein WEU31_04575 [Morganella morganii]|uniref:hypothetical protein n=2 Tax=Morganella morganii TaxID=582 RepID=UPI0030D18C64
MAGKTVTHGWDAIVVYQRGQANNMLKQQYIKRFMTGNMLEPVNDELESSTATKLLIHNLTLSAPHLFFNKAGTGDSTAQVAMNFVKGMIIYKEKDNKNNYRVVRIEKITPLSSSFIAMNVPLSKAPGSVSEIGKVQFDIKKGDHFTNNLSVYEIEQDAISGFFQHRFEAAPEEQRTFELGTISNYKDEQFQPEQFFIRTMGAPNTASRGSQDEGDGAVVLFVQMRGSDSEPGKTEADWLLADNYTSALVISNKNLLDSITAANGEAQKKFKLKKYAINDNENSTWGLKTASSEFYLQFLFDLQYPFPGTGVMTQCNFYHRDGINLFNPSDILTPYSLNPSYAGDDNQLNNIFNTEVQTHGVIFHFDYRREDGQITRYEYRFNIKINIKMNVNYVADTDSSEGKSGVVISRVMNDNDTIVNYSISDIYPGEGLSEIDIDIIEEFIMGILKNITTKNIKEKITFLLESIDLIYINTFIIQNMLFPGNNYFRSEFAFIPGDLLVQGQLAPGSESFAVTPTETTIVAGFDYQFTTTPDISGVKWSLSGTEKGNTNADLGHIDAATGKYTAPQAATVTEGVRHVVVCAEKGDTKVYALASVIMKGVSVSPTYYIVQPNSEIKLTANSVNGGELTWDMGENKQGSSLTKVTNNEYTYKAGKMVAKLNLNLERVTVTDEKGASGEALILIPNSTMTGKITVSYDNVPADSVKLIYTVIISDIALDENGDPIYDDDGNLVFEEKEVVASGKGLNWAAVETGGATFDKATGILTSAPGVGDGFAVIRVTYTVDRTQYRSAIVIPLPLSTYKKTILAAYSPEQV